MWNQADKPIQPGNFFDVDPPHQQGGQQDTGHFGLTWHSSIAAILRPFLQISSRQILWDVFYMFYVRVCYVIIADDWMVLSFKVVFSVDLMVFVCDYKGILTPWIIVSSAIFLLGFYLLIFPTDDI
jgi:hypothetical protein